MAVIQNNRDFQNSQFLAAYETLLEKMSPHYSRYYRNLIFYKKCVMALESIQKRLLYIHTIGR